MREGKVEELEDVINLGHNYYIRVNIEIHGQYKTSTNYSFKIWLRCRSLLLHDTFASADDI
jgi:hypothetical protein